ncbi:hypothetical protein HDE_06611 [Halotydeus destructor]|nr:hypothetical protein HDE_06611 [Halotydeus destructor]
MLTHAAVVCNNGQSRDRVKGIKKVLASRKAGAKKERSRSKVKHVVRAMDGGPKKFAPINSLTTLGKTVDMVAVKMKIRQLKCKATEEGNFPKV